MLACDEHLRYEILLIRGSEAIDAAAQFDDRMDVCARARSRCAVIFNCRNRAPNVSDAGLETLAPISTTFNVNVKLGWRTEVFRHRINYEKWNRCVMRCRLSMAGSQRINQKVYLKKKKSNESESSTVLSRANGNAHRNPKRMRLHRLMFAQRSSHSCVNRSSDKSNDFGLPYATLT